MFLNKDHELGAKFKMRAKGLFDYRNVGKAHHNFNTLCLPPVGSSVIKLKFGGDPKYPARHTCKFSTSHPLTEIVTELILLLLLGTQNSVLKYVSYLLI